MKFLFSRPAARCLAGLAALCFGAAVLAQTPSAAAAPSPRGALHLADALAATLRGAPTLAGYAYERRAAEARALQAALRPNPEVGVDVENLLGSRAYQGIDSLNVTLRFGSLIERGGKREARMALAARSADSVDASEALARLDAIVQTTSAFIDVVESQQQLVLAERAIEYAEQTLAGAERRIQAGAASSIERNRAIIALERARLEREHYEHQLATQRRQLTANWGETEPLFDSASAELLQLPEVPDWPDLLARLRRSPDFARYDVERRVREAELSLAQSKAAVDPTVYAGVRLLRDGMQSPRTDAALVAYLLTPLPWNNRNQGAIAEARAQRDRVDADRHVAQIKAETALYEQVQELRHARTLVDSLQDTLLPQADEALKLIRNGYANGRLSQLDVIDAQRTRLELEAELLSNAADYHRRLAAIERMTALAAPAASPTDITESLP